MTMVDALMALIAKWRDHARFLESLPPASDDDRDHADRLRQCADELEAALLQAAAPPAPTAECGNWTPLKDGLRAPTIADHYGHGWKAGREADPLKGIRDAKYLNPVCSENGCQWLHRVGGPLGEEDDCREAQDNTPSKVPYPAAAPLPAPQESQQPANAPPFVDTPLKAAIRVAFDNPTVANIQCVAEVAAQPVRPLETLKRFTPGGEWWDQMVEANYGEWVRFEDVAALLQAAAPPAPTAELSQNEQAWEDLRADGGLPESHPPKFDIGERLHAVLTQFGIASRSDMYGLHSALIKWAADSCRQSIPAAPPERVSEGKE